MKKKEKPTTHFSHQVILGCACDKFKSLRGHRGDVSASLTRRENARGPGRTDLPPARPVGRVVKVRATQGG